MKCLLMTNQLFGWTGSEIIIVELCEYLIGAGHKVAILCNQLDNKFVKPLREIGATVVNQPDDINLAEFDFCYTQHQMLNLVIAELCQTKVQKFPFICYGHLSPYQELEFPGPLIEGLFADRIVANSQETAAKLHELGMGSDRVSLFPNPAPNGFFGPTDQAKTLRKILVISNHLPTELSQALTEIEKSGVRITKIGSEFGQSRIQPKTVFDHDAVVSIGKSVQYALAAKRPVFCYDHFGGPGWLTAANYQRTAANNFSGRPECRKIDSYAIAKELCSGFDEASRFAVQFDAISAGFSLDQQMAEMLSATKIVLGDQERLKKLNTLLNSLEHTQPILREAAISNVLREEKIHSFGLTQLVAKQSARLQKIKRTRKGIIRRFFRVKK